VAEANTPVKQMQLQETAFVMRGYAGYWLDYVSDYGKTASEPSRYDSLAYDTSVDWPTLKLISWSYGGEKSATSCRRLTDEGIGFNELRLCLFIIYDCR
jgi:hypothetical protein